LQSSPPKEAHTAMGGPTITTMTKTLAFKNLTDLKYAKSI